MINRRTFPIDNASPYAVRAMAEHLQAGGRLVLFAEGRITLTGSLMKVYDGTGFLVRQSGAKVITCYLRGAARGRFVRHPGGRAGCRASPRISATRSPPRNFPVLSNAAARAKVTTWLRDRMTASSSRSKWRSARRTCSPPSAKPPPTSRTASR
jgi:acyl-[acyl-carrier-protein]-phospholipid O-acyltransferase/long-chain-fatty-acid--[acyl-carrier-protein] ligase